MLVLVLQYLLFVSVACCGVIQLAARSNKLAGLSFFRNKFLAYAFAALTIGGSYAWFFASDNRSRQGLEGTQQVFGFAAAAAVAVIFTLIVSSLLQHKLRGREPAPGSGVEALKEMTYFQALRHTLAPRSKETYK